VMSDEAQEDKTEAPSARRMSEAREKGSIPIGRELNAVAGFAVGTLALMAVSVPLRDGLLRLIAASAGGLGSPDPQNLGPLMARPLMLAFYACAAAGAAGAAAYLFQTKGQIWTNLVLPDLSRLFGMGRLGQLFSRQMWVDLGFSLVKVVTVGWVVWDCLRDEFMTLPALLFARPDAQFATLFGPLAKGAVKVLTVMGIWAGVDIAIQRWKFYREMKMTKQEAIRDAKEDDGDPAMRGRRKKKHRELLKGMARMEVPRADALVVNPTHIAIAIRYRPGEDKAPRVTAKGKGELAEMMRSLARENGVPIVENIPLARLLFKRVKVGRSVPAETYKAVAAVLAYVYRITRRSGAEAR
jgi:flagellar biosynthetic protein FlhB